MNRKVKYAAAVLALTLLAGACGKPVSGTDGTQAPQITLGVTDVTKTPSPENGKEPTEVPVPTATPEPTKVPEPTVTPEPTPTPEPWVGGSEAANIIANMTIGWNLGNTLDSKVKSETAWGNPATTQEMIDKVAEAGFNTIRIPTTWYCRADKEFTIDTAWLERVKEVVDYCYKNDMYVILNTHHETDWMVPTLDKIDDVEKNFVYLWQQIAEYFKDYDEHLLFEGMNEPRVVGHAQEWNGGTTEQRQLINRLNNAFVETVRATGGNNETRCLLITSYGANSSRIAMYAVKVPNDPYVGVSIHAYTPYFFTFYSDSPQMVYDWDGSKENEINTLFNDIDSVFLSKGIPVLLTEFGAENKSNRAGGENNPESRIRWVDYYVSKATEYGVPCCYWDNGIFNASGEQFGLLNRRQLTWYEPEYVETMVNAAKK